MQSKSSRIAVIDIGTNTCLLLIAELDESGRMKVIHESQELPRMGEGVSETGSISKEAMNRVAKVLKSYVKIANKNKVDRFYSVGTSALRDAQNKDDVIEFFKNKADIDVQLLSGETEAKFGYYGSLFDLDESGDYTVLDIGGGSTENSYLDKKHKFHSKSLDIGSVRIKEKFFKDGYTEKNIAAAKEFIHKAFSKINFLNLLEKKLVGVAGTVTTLSAIKNRLKEFDEKKIHKDTLNIQQAEVIFEGLCKMNEEEILSFGEILKGRADIIIPGTLILLEFMKTFGFDNITVSTKGLRYGVFLYLVKS